MMISGLSEETKKKVEELRNSSVEFKTVFDEAKSKIEEQITRRNNSRAFEPTCSRDYCMRVYVKALPLTAEEFEYLNRYLTEAYLEQVLGDKIIIKKYWLDKNYTIYTEKPPESNADDYL